MKKYLLPLFAFFTVITARAQFITTNPSTTPVTIGSDLNMAANKVINFNGVPTIKSFGNSNFGLGAFAGNLANTGQFNVTIGAYAGNGSTSGDYNVFIGQGAGQNANGSGNLASGLGSLYANTGNNNTAFGIYAGQNNTGTNNIFFGASSGAANQGNQNIFFGIGSGSLNTAGGDNTFIGTYAGQPNTTGLFNTFIGAYSKSTNNAIQRATAIGYNSNVTVSDGFVLGDPVSAAAKVGIGTAAPTEKLHVNGTVRFENLPTDAPGAPATSYVVIDATGKLFKYTGTAPARIGAPEGTTAGLPTSFTENWTLKNDFLYNKNKKGIIIGEGITSLPKGYGMYVTEGILTEKVKVAIKNSSDWADYVFNKDYKKMSLTEVEKFISVNKHLPNMLSASEMVTEGNDLAKTDAKLLEKIEELTLYMIEMKKENTQMKRQINSLKRKINK